MLQIQGRRYDTGEAVRIEIEGERIRSVEKVAAQPGTDKWPLIAPGLFDLQINGHGGTWFSDESLTPERVIRTLEPHFKFGITRLMPTLVTASHEAFVSGFTAIRKACEQDRWVNQMVAGCHQEGPYISHEDGPRGAHPLQHVRAADWDEFCRYQEASGGRIRLLTLAPEAEGAVPFIRKAVASGITIAIGHTGANSDQVTAAVDAGARLSTHLGNGAHGQICRHPNYIWDQLGDSRLMASIITDGHHLPPSVIRSIIAAKGTSNVVITCDAAGLAGCPPGKYQAASGQVEILDDGRIVIAGQNQLLAGSSLATDVCVAHVMNVADLSLREAFDMAGRNPCHLLGCEEVQIAAGSRADLVTFDYAGPGSRILWNATIASGELRFGSILH
ncbi:MAG: amidohydrolase family protein [Planctomycetota bacterium]|nr:amidohydrolase family protein [Planctomycetota bacterium]MDA1164318.1 amidohydrolase family protein [Planctomycetota bacterium]